MNGVNLNPLFHTVLCTGYFNIRGASKMLIRTANRVEFKLSTLDPAGLKVHVKTVNRRNGISTSHGKIVHSFQE